MIQVCILLVFVNTLIFFDSKLKEFVSGDERTILAWASSVSSNASLDQEFIALLPFFKRLPHQEELTKKLRSYLRIAPEFSPSRRIRLLFYLNDKNADLLIDQISSDMVSIHLFLI